MYNKSKYRKSRKIKKLIFLTEKKGVKILNAEFPQEVVTFVRKEHKVNIKFVVLDS